MSAADRAVWYKSWTETRGVFGIGVLFLMANALALYVGYPDDYAQRFPNGTLAVGADQVRALLHDGPAYIWLSWFGTSLVLGLSFIALAVAGTGLGKNPEGGPAPGVTYALSMPVTRRTLAGVRMTAGILELVAAAVVPSLLVCALAPTQGQAFPIARGMTHALLAAIGVTSLYGLFVFLSATLGELAKAVAGGAVLLLYGAFTFLTSGVREYSVFRLMTGDTYYLRGEIPWIGLLASVAFAATLMYASLRVVERRDF